jgi:hypothetical protein
MFLMMEQKWNGLTNYIISFNVFLIIKFFLLPLAKNR